MTTTSTAYDLILNNLRTAVDRLNHTAGWEGDGAYIGAVAEAAGAAWYVFLPYDDSTVEGFDRIGGWLDGDVAGVSHAHAQVSAALRVLSALRLSSKWSRD